MKFVAFLRAINVGGHVVKMDALRRHFEELGLARVETFIASGNVLFETQSRSAPALERKIEAHLKAKLGYDVATFLRTPAEVASAAAAKPFPPADLNDPGHALYVGFLSGSPSPASKSKLAVFESDIHAFKILGRELYWLCRGKFSDSKFTGAKLEKTLGMPATLRNVTTVRRIAALFE